MNVRLAAALDRADIIDVYMSAFADDEKEIVSKLAVDLLSGSAPPPICLVTEHDDGIIAHVAFSPVHIACSGEVGGSILAPLAVRPKFQKQGVGTKLVEHGLQLLRNAGTYIVFVYGDPAYYGRFGFRAGTAEPFSPPHKLSYPYGWQALVLNESISGIQPASLSCVSALDDPDLW